MAVFDTARKTEMYQFFIVAFNAAPGATYLSQLQAAVEADMTTLAIVEVFTMQAQFTSVYPVSMSHEEFATSLVGKVIGNSATVPARQAAVELLVSALDAGMSRGEVIYNVFGNLANRELDPDQPGYDPGDPYLGVAQQFANRIKVAAYFTEVLGEASTSVPVLQQVVENVTNHTAVATTDEIDAFLANPLLGLQLQFSAGVDVLGSSQGADVFALGNMQSAQDGDTLVGFETGKDQLHLTLDFTLAPQRGTAGAGIVVNLGRYALSASTAAAESLLDGNALAPVHGGAGHVAENGGLFFVDMNGNGVIDDGDIRIVSDAVIAAGDVHTTVHGTIGSDVLRGGQGSDALHGGQGADKFVLVGAIDEAMQGHYTEYADVIAQTLVDEGIDEVLNIAELTTLRSVSEANAGDVIEGGAITRDTLYGFGILDLALVNGGGELGVEHLKLFSQVRLTAAQLQGLDVLELVGGGEHILVLTDEAGEPLSLEQQQAVFIAWMNQPGQQLVHNGETLKLGGDGTEEMPAIEYDLDDTEGLPFEDETPEAAPLLDVSVTAGGDLMINAAEAGAATGLLILSSNALRDVVVLGIAGGQPVEIPATLDAVSLLWQFDASGLDDGLVVVQVTDMFDQTLGSVLHLDTVAPAAPVIDNAVDDEPTGQTLLDSGATTNDFTPTYTGSGAEPGSTISLHVNGALLGQALVAPDGTWSIALVDALPAGDYSAVASATDQAGNLSAASVPFLLTLALNNAPQIAGDGTALSGLEFVRNFDNSSDSIPDESSGTRGSITIVPSGSSGIVTDDGSPFALMANGTSPVSGPFTDFGGYSSTWPGDWTSQIKVWLDPAWADNQGFDWTVASNGADGAHQRDFIFHAWKVAGTLYVAGSNNTDFAVNAWKIDNEFIGDKKFAITNAGWYTLEHRFTDDGGVLAVELHLLDADGESLWSTTRTSEADTIPAEIGGNRYGWFTFANVDGGVGVDALVLDLPGAQPRIVEFVDGSALEGIGEHNASGELVFTDIDPDDVHSVATSPAEDGYLGTFSAGILPGDEAGGGAGIVSWNFSVDDAALDFLEAGQTLAQIYTVTVDDGQGGTASADITVTLVGSSDLV